MSNSFVLSCNIFVFLHSFPIIYTLLTEYFNKKNDIRTFTCNIAKYKIRENKIKKGKDYEILEFADAE